MVLDWLFRFCPWDKIWFLQLVKICFNHINCGFFLDLKTWMFLWPGPWSRLGSDNSSREGLSTCLQSVVFWQRDKKLGANFKWLEQQYSSPGYVLFGKPLQPKHTVLICSEWGSKAGYQTEYISESMKTIIHHMLKEFTRLICQGFMWKRGLDSVIAGQHCSEETDRQKDRIPLWSGGSGRVQRFDRSEKQEWDTDVSASQTYNSHDKTLRCPQRFDQAELRADGVLKES